MINDTDHEQTITDEELKATKIRNYFHRKTVRYADADFKAGRLKDLEGNGYFGDFDYKEEFVNVEWLMNCINKCCGGCGCEFSIDVDENNYFHVESDITAQRLDNALPHDINNIVPMCINCNCSNK